MAQQDFFWFNKIKVAGHCDKESIKFIYSALLVTQERERKWALDHCYFFYLRADEDFQGAALHKKTLEGRHLILLNEATLLAHARKCGARNKGKGLYGKDANWHFLERLAAVIYHEVMHLKLGHTGGNEAVRNRHECKVQFLESKYRRKIRQTMKKMPWVWINHNALQ